MAENTESPVTVHENTGTIKGQPQAQPAEPHDGSTLVNEVLAHTDKVILDPNDELAVQVPEGVGASTVGETTGLADALRAGTAEEQFARERGDDEPAAEEATQVEPEDTGFAREENADEESDE